MGSSALTGGRVNYYLATVKFPQREDQPAYTAECEDIIQALQMDFNEACEFKAIWRTAAARLGNGKPGQKALYDAEKRLHYAGRSVAELRRAESRSVKIHVFQEMVWYDHMSGEFPEGMNRMDMVSVRLNDNTTQSARFAEKWDWKSISNPASIAQFCITKRA